MKSLFLLTCSLCLSACALVGPNYRESEPQLSAHYKEQANQRLGIRSDWWKLFGDSQLNSLEATLESENLELKAAFARRQLALAQLGIAESNRWVQLNGNGSAQRQKDSTTGRGGAFLGEYFEQYQIGSNFSYELDLWGRVQREIEAGTAQAQAADATLAQVRVALQTQLARQYFALRFLDAEMSTLDAAVETRRESLRLTDSRLTAGAGTELDRARATSELATAEADRHSLEGPRATLENSIAILLGRDPSRFKISRKTPPQSLPSVPSGIPAGLIYRRPDIAAAERRLAAATARIGVAEAAHYPRFSLTGSAGFRTVSSQELLNWNSSFFGFGPSLDLPIFQGGRIRAGVAASKAQQAEAFAELQQQTLQAVGEVENSLARLRALSAEIQSRQSAVKAIQSSYDLAKLRYSEGATSYLEVVDAQRETLAAERRAISTRGQQFEATITLIQALGGGFQRR